MTAIVVLSVIALVVLIVALRGFVLSFLWAWFITPLGLPEISVAHAVGIALTVHLIAGKVKSEEGNDPEIGTNILAALLALFVGWLVHRLFMA